MIYVLRCCIVCEKFVKVFSIFVYMLSKLQVKSEPVLPSMCGMLTLKRHFQSYAVSTSTEFVHLISVSVENYFSQLDLTINTRWQYGDGKKVGLRIVLIGFDSQNLNVIKDRERRLFVCSIYTLLSCGDFYYCSNSKFFFPQDLQLRATHAADAGYSTLNSDLTPTLTSSRLE